MKRSVPTLTLAALGLAGGATWLWRHQGEIATRRPFNEWTFTHMDAVMPTEPVPAGAPTPWPRGSVDLAPVRYVFGGRERSLADLHRATCTTAMVVVHRGRLVHEEYPGRFAAPTRRFQLFSLTKSVTSLLLGIAYDDGLLPGLDTDVGDLLPELAGSAYASVSVEDLLQMSSGVGDLEDWTVPDALINRFERAVTGGGSVLDVIRGAQRTAEPGEVFNYSTLDTHVLGWILERVTGTTLARWTSERLWTPLGAEVDAYHFLTRGRPRTALGGGSLNATARDLARVGQLMLQDGAWQGRQVVPASWVRRCTRPLSPGHDAGRLGPSGAAHYGYSTQWWLVGDRPGAVTGLGVHGQYLWIDPRSQTVVVRTAAWPTADDEDRDAETFAALTALCDHLEATT